MSSIAPLFPIPPPLGRQAHSYRQWHLMTHICLFTFQDRAVLNAFIHYMYDRFCPAFYASSGRIKSDPRQYGHLTIVGYFRLSVWYWWYNPERTGLHTPCALLIVPSTSLLSIHVRVVRTRLHVILFNRVCSGMDDIQSHVHYQSYPLPH